jgi:5S rRNA maturation endonuclease (ribonuclease M5)
MKYKETIEILEKNIDDLTEENKQAPIIVEGNKDVAALRKLGVTGEIIRINTGISIPDFCDKLAQRYKQIILLTDWDEKGGQLFSMIKKNLKGRVTCITTYRDVFATHSTVRTIEGIPSWIQTLKAKVDE